MFELQFSSFDSSIGKIFYICRLATAKKPTADKSLVADKNIIPEKKAATNKTARKNNAVLVFLSNSEKSFSDYLKKLKVKYPDAVFSDKKSAATEAAVKDYLEGKKRKIDLEYQFLTGSSFEKKIWETTASISCGSVASYREIAEKSGNAGAWRAAGTALGNNPIMLVIPCHRVIKSSGDIGFFGGGEKVKEFLLDMEAKKQN